MINDVICAQGSVIGQAMCRFINLFYELKLLNFSNLSTCNYLLLITIFCTNRSSSVCQNRFSLKRERRRYNETDLSRERSKLQEF